MAAKSATSTKKKTTAAVGLKSPRTPKDDNKSKAHSTSRGNPSSKATTNNKEHLLKTGLNASLVEKATEALLKYHEKTLSINNKKTDLLGSDQQILVQFTLLRTPQASSKKPTRIMIPHPLFQLATNNNKNSTKTIDSLEEPEVCLIVKEESKPWVQDMISRFPDEMGCIKKVLGLQSLRTKHARYEQRRTLLHKYNVFMADDRILPMLSKALGSDFYKTKKLPIPITLTRKEALPFTIQRALNATYLSMSKGTCITIRAGTTAMTCQQLTENILEIAKGAVPHMPLKWANIQNIAIKTPESVALPIYNKTPEVLREIAAAAGVLVSGDDAALNKEIDTPEKELDTTTPVSAKKETPTSEKKREMKSPLLRALKKQKQEETKATKKETKEETPKEKKRPSDAGNTPKKQNQEETKTTKKQTKEETPKEKKRPSEAKNTPKKMESPKDAKKETTKSINKKGDKPEVSPAKPSTHETARFIACKTFNGSKVGYVFRMGKEGLGYYVDIKPKVDRMAMEALMRAGKSKGRDGGQNKGKKGRKSW